MKASLAEWLRQLGVLLPIAAALRPGAGPRPSPAGRPASARAPSRADLSLLDQVPVAAIATDVDANITYWNSHAEELFGWRREEATGRSIIDLLVPPPYLDRMASITATLRAAHAWQGEAVLQRKDGSRRIALTTAGALRDARGEPVGFVCTATDVSERRRAADDLRRSEATLRAILESDERGLVLIDRERNVGAFNRRAVAFLGSASPGTLRIGEPLARAVTARQMAILEPQIAAALEGRSTREPVQLEGPDGTVHWYEHEAAPARDGDAAIVGVCLAAREIDDRIRAGAALGQAAAVSTALARVGQELIAALSSPSFLHRLCRVTAEVLECELSHTLLLRAEEEVFVPIAAESDAPERREGMRLVRMPKEMIREVSHALERDNVVTVGEIPEAFVAQVPALADFEAIVLALRRGDELVGLQTAQRRRTDRPFTDTQLKIARGIAQLASLALNHARAVEDLEQANRIKSDFVATMSHELRTPLHVILGYSDLLLSGEFGEMSAPQATTIERLHRRAQELNELIVSTLDVSRIESGRVGLNVEEVPLGDVLAEIEADSRRRIGPAGPTFAVHIAESIPSLHTDVTKLKVVLKNLVGNALKFTDRGRISVEARPTGNGVELAVADTGLGIAPELLANLFQPFRQGDQSPSRRHGGVGLGLYIVRRLLEIMGGTVRVESEPGRGSTFTVWLPLRPPGVAGEAPVKNPTG